MAVVASELLSKNGGQVPTSLFPDQDDAEVLSQLNAYLVAGYVRAAADAVPVEDVDDAATAWAYHRTYDDLYQTMSAAPSSATIDGEGSSSFTADQRATFEIKAREWREEYDALVPDVEEADEGWTKVRSLR